MLGNVTIAEVKEQIDGGDKQSLMDQGMIARAHQKAARDEKLSVRQKWGPKRRKLQILLDVLEMDEPKEATE